MARKLLTKDVAAMALILGKMKIKEEMMEFVKGLQEGKSQEALGVDLIFTLIDGAGRAGVIDELYNFIGSIIEMSGEEVENLPFEDLKAKLKETADAQSWVSFFSSAAKSMLTN